MIGSAIIALVLVGLIALCVHDRRQTAHTILRNYPIVGYFRYFAETLGEYMRQYQYLPEPGGQGEARGALRQTGPRGGRDHACGLTDPSGFPPKHVTDIEREVGGFRAAEAGG